MQLLSQYPDPPHCPQWAIGPLEFQQKSKMESSIALEAETAIVKYFYDLHNCNRLIDVGCWTGVLALKMHKLINPAEMILVDAVPMYLRMSRELFKAHKINNVYAEELCIVKDPKAFPGYFKINLSDSINTSNVLEQIDQMKDKIVVQMPTVPAVDVKTATGTLSKLITDQTYFKLDVDSMDYAVITELINSGVKPVAMNFECLIDTPARKNELRRVLKLLGLAGYYIPESDYIIDNYQMLDFFTGNQGWAAMTYTYTPGTGPKWTSIVCSDSICHAAVFLTKPH